jgi:3-phosphoshikimate 1-carboxyvinyltransferase
MDIPDLIEIVPLDKPVRAEITVPGSKSITNRALILAALADGEVTLTSALWSEDTEIMLEAMRKLGFKVKIQQDPNEVCNRIITIQGQGGKIPKAGRSANPLKIYVGNAGTAARFLTAFLCLRPGIFELHGSPRMRARPQTELLNALRPKYTELLAYYLHPTSPKPGYAIESLQESNMLPIRIYGMGPRPGKKCRVSIKKSSQFASALLLCAKVSGWKVEVVGENAEESPYVAMTSKMIEAFPHRGGKFQIEPDASSGSYFWGANFLICLENANSTPNSFVFVRNWPTTGWQIDGQFSHFWPPSSVLSRKDQLGDSIMTAIVLAPFLTKPASFVDLGKLRHQETERVVALRTELTKCGAKVVEEGDTLTVWPSPLHGAEIETYNDHRMAMCFAILGLKVSGIKIKNPACVKKTFPNFFQKLAAQPPHGLGAEIWEIKDGQRTRKLSGDDLFAD